MIRREVTKRKYKYILVFRKDNRKLEEVVVSDNEMTQWQLIRFMKEVGFFAEHGKVKLDYIKTVNNERSISKP